MRWVAVFTITLLVAGVQCLSACTLSSWAQQAPPCHQHHKAPAQSSNVCDHEDAVNAASLVADVPLPLIAFDLVPPALRFRAAWMTASGAGLAAFSIRRI
jgi:hypothetical protein